MVHILLNTTLSYCSFIRDKPAKIQKNNTIQVKHVTLTLQIITYISFEFGYVIVKKILYSCVYSDNFQVTENIYLSNQLIELFLENRY